MHASAERVPPARLTGRTPSVVEENAGSAYTVDAAPVMAGGGLTARHVLPASWVAKSCSFASPPTSHPSFAVGKSIRPPAGSRSCVHLTPSTLLSSTPRLRPKRFG